MPVIPIPSIGITGIIDILIPINVPILKCPGRQVICHMTVVLCDSYCDTSGIRQNGIHYHILAVIQKLCRVTDNSCEVNTIRKKDVGCRLHPCKKLIVNI